MIADLCMDLKKGDTLILNGTEYRAEIISADEIKLVAVNKVEYGQVWERDNMLYFVSHKSGDTITLLNMFGKIFKHSEDYFKENYTFSGTTGKELVGFTVSK